jgi:hypothetical protein
MGEGGEEKEAAMRERATQVWLILVAVLLFVHLFRSEEDVRAGQSESESVPAVLRARMIELVDEHGQVRANLKVEPDGAAVFRLRDAKGTIRVKLGASEHGSGLVLLDDRTEVGAHLLADRKGTALTLAERDKEKRVIEP